MKIARLLIGVFVIVARPSGAQESRWMALYRDSGVRILADSTRLQALPDGSYSIWTSWRFATSKKLAGVGTYRSLTSHVFVKCGPTVHKTGTTIFYNSAADPIHTIRVTDSELAIADWEDDIPDTLGELAHRAICQKIPRLLLPPYTG